MPGALFPLCEKKSPGMGAILAVLLLALLTAAAPSAHAAPQASITDLEDEVMCPVCGTLLELAESPQAQRQRALIRRLIREGRDKQEVKDTLVSQYGDEVLALPGDSGFDLTAYLVPAIGFAAAALALALGVRRWRRSGGPPDSRPGGPAPPRGEDAERLDADLARYDL